MRAFVIVLAVVGIVLSSGVLAQQQPQEKQQKNAKTAVEPQEEITKLKKQVADLKPYAATNEKLVKRLMRAVHRDAESPLVTFDSLLNQKEPKPDWAVLDAKASLVEIMAISMDVPHSKGQGYKKVADELRAATKARDFKKFKASVKQLHGTCSQCHGWAPPA